MYHINVLETRRESLVSSSLRVIDSRKKALLYILGSCGIENIADYSFAQDYALKNKLPIFYLNNPYCKNQLDCDNPQTIEIERLLSGEVNFANSTLLGEGTLDHDILVLSNFYQIEIFGNRTLSKTASRNLNSSGIETVIHRFPLILSS